MANTIETISYTRSPNKFATILRKQVHQYFQTQKLQPTSSPSMKWRLIILSGMWIGLYTMLLTGHLPCAFLVLSMVLFHFVLFQLALTAHDGSHNAVSSNPKTNKWIYRIFDLAGVNSYLWEFDHVISHHGLPNVSGYDSNMYMYPAIRLDPYAPKKWFHRYQHIYALFMYAHATLFKVFLADFVNFKRERIGMIEVGKHPNKELFYLIGTKAFAISYIYIIPFLFISAPAWQIILSMYVGHLVSGIALGLIFQVTHTNLLVSQVKPNHQGKISHSYEEHVFSTTADFAVHNKVIAWMTGGLNIHAVHHMFPNMSQMHLPQIAKIVRKTCTEHNVPYLEFPTWRTAISSHFQALKQLGQA
ncbi:MAG: hypothetical protein GY810_18880 [Aureispira sp.]|nr:hypothetical protein [Aureispira sp.]